MSVIASTRRAALDAEPATDVRANVDATSVPATLIVLVAEPPLITTVEFRGSVPVMLSAATPAVDD